MPAMRATLSDDLPIVTVHARQARLIAYGLCSRARSLDHCNAQTLIPFAGSRRLVRRRREVSHSYLHRAIDMMISRSRHSSSSGLLMDASTKATMLVRRDDNTGSDCFARLNLSAYTNLGMIETSPLV